MSERGSFVTEYIYCDKCLEAACNVLTGDEKYLMSTQVPHWNKGDKPLPIISGKIGGLYPGEEIDTFENEFVPKLEGSICHPLRVAVLAEKGERIFVVTPTTKEGA